MKVGGVARWAMVVALLVGCGAPPAPRVERASLPRPLAPVPAPPPAPPIARWGELRDAVATRAVRCWRREPRTGDERHPTRLTLRLRRSADGTLAARLGDERDVPFGFSRCLRVELAQVRVAPTMPDQELAGLPFPPEVQMVLLLP